MHDQASGGVAPDGQRRAARAPAPRRARRGSARVQALRGGGGAGASLDRCWRAARCSRSRRSGSAPLVSARPLHPRACRRRAQDHAAADRLARPRARVVTSSNAAPSAWMRFSSRSTLVAAPLLERPGGLVGEDHRRAVHDRARDRGALPLARRQLGGIRAPACAGARPLPSAYSTRGMTSSSREAARDPHRERHVLEHACGRSSRRKSS